MLYIRFPEVIHLIVLKLFFFVFWPHLAACEILVPRPGIKPTPLALEVRSFNHWTAREVPVVKFLILSPGGMQWKVLSIHHRAYSSLEPIEDIFHRNLAVSLESICLCLRGSVINA